MDLPQNGSSATPSILDLPKTVLHHVFELLGPRDLVMCGATCQSWADTLSDTASDAHWKRVYLQRWSAPVSGHATRNIAGGGGRGGWRGAYSWKMASLGEWERRFRTNYINGHSGAVKAVRLCPEMDLLVTGSSDRTVRLWDLSSACPRGKSLLHGGTARCLAVDASLIASGSSDGFIRCWRAWPGAKPGACPFVVTGEQPKKLAGHTGPVSSLELAGRHLYSGSWDMTVRRWERDEDGAARSCDSVWGPRVFAAAGKHLVVQDAETGKPLTKFRGVFGGEGAALEATHNGQFAFSGGSGGQVLLHDLRMAPSREGAALLWQGSPGSTVTSLSLEDPWLALSTTDGMASLLNLQDALRASQSLGRPLQDPTRSAQEPKRRHVADGMPLLHAIDMKDRWIAYGGDDAVARTCECNWPRRGRVASSGFRGKQNRKGQQSWRGRRKPSRGSKSAVEQVPRKSFGTNSASTSFSETRVREFAKGNNNAKPSHVPREANPNPSSRAVPVSKTQGVTGGKSGARGGHSRQGRPS